MKRTRVKGRKANATGRSQTSDRFFMLKYSMARSPAFRSLSGPALKVFLELRCHFDGANNGGLFLSYADAAKRLGIGKTTAHRAFKELQEKGFVRRTRRGDFGHRLAATWLGTDCKRHDGELATNDWRSWQPKKKTIGPHAEPKSKNGSATGPIIGHRSATGPTNGAKATADGSALGLHLHSTMGVADSEERTERAAAAPRKRASGGERDPETGLRAIGSVIASLDRRLDSISGPQAGGSDADHSDVAPAATANPGPSGGFRRALP